MTTTKCIGAVKISGREYMVYVNTTDGTATDLTIRDLAGNLKTIAQIFKDGGVLEHVHVTVATPSDMDRLQLLDAQGGIINEWIGCIEVALGHRPQMWIDGIRCRFPAGAQLSILTSD